MIVQYRKARCDNCGKEKIVEGLGSLPFGWLTISVAQTHGLMSNIILTKEFCSKKCAIVFMNKINDIPKSKEVRSNRI